MKCLNHRFQPRMERNDGDSLHDSASGSRKHSLW